MVGASGRYPGPIPRSMWDAGEGLAISVLTIAVDGPAEELAAGILKILDTARNQPTRQPLKSGLIDSSAIAPAVSPAGDIDLDRFTGRFAALWGVTDVVRIGDKIYAVSPVGPSPLVQPAELEVIDDTTLRIMSGSPYGSVGELFRYERDAGGAIISVFAGGMKAWPIEVYRGMSSVLQSVSAPV